MKDFAKSIHVGNADSVIHRDGDFKIKYNEKENSYELYFNSIYYDTFHTKQQALDRIELYKKRKEDRKKSGNSKVGNFRSKEQLLADIKELEKYIKDHPDQGCEKEKRLLGEAKEELDKKYGILVGNEKAISSTFHMNNYGIEVGQWSWDWKNGAPEKAKQEEIERKIKAYVSQINKDVKSGDSDERDEVFSKLDKFVRAQGLNKKVGNSKVGNASVDQAEAREFQQSIMPIKRLIEDAGVAIYSNPKEAISNLQRAKQECDKAISWAKNI